MLRECRNVDLFEKVEKISEGSYGIVYKVCQCLKTSMRFLPQSQNHWSHINVSGA